MAALQDELLPCPELEQAGDASTRFPPLMILLHWLTLGFLVLSAACVFGRDLAASRSGRLWLLAGHRHLGLLVICATCLRLACRFLFKDTLRAIESSLSKPVRLIAHATHSLLYGLLLGLPLLGWMLSNARGTTVTFLGLMRLPSLAPLDLDRADTLATWHQWGGWCLYGLVALHAAAALWHHYLIKDHILRAMLPAWRLGRKGQNLISSTEET
jgi:cytochrome b561